MLGENGPVALSGILQRGVGLGGRLDDGSLLNQWNVVVAPLSVPLPAGSYRIEAFSGIETKRTQQQFELRPGASTCVTVTLERFSRVAERGWRSANTHLHMMKIDQVTADRYLTEVPAAVTQHRSAVPPALADLIMKCLEKKAADRWQDTADVLRQLEALATPSGGITPTDTRPLAAVPSARSRTPLAVAAAAALVIAVGVVWQTVGVGEGAVDLDPNLVAVLPFRMSGDPQFDYLGEGVVDLFQATLTGDGGPRAVASQTAISAWRRAGGLAEQALTEDEAGSVAASLGAGLLLPGSMVGSPDNLVLTATMARVGANDDPVQANGQRPRGQCRGTHGPAHGAAAQPPGRGGIPDRLEPNACFTTGPEGLPARADRLSRGPIRRRPCRARPRLGLRLDVCPSGAGPFAGPRLGSFCPTFAREEDRVGKP
ncbi:MAG: hypothetical protein IID05_08355 [Gemmatimonadetes bacterium]|nr:hypothetical protein [Gemmatimonadota bacterium]